MKKEFAVGRNSNISMPLKTPMPCSSVKASRDPFLIDILPLAILVFQDMPIKLAESEPFWKIGLWLEFLLPVDICTGHFGLHAYVNSLHLKGIMPSKQLLINFTCMVILWMYWKYSQISTVSGFDLLFILMLPSNKGMSPFVMLRSSWYQIHISFIFIEPYVTFWSQTLKMFYRWENGELVARLY